MKISFLVFLCISWFSFSQNKQILFGLSETPQSLLINPGGKVENTGYIGVPFLSHIHANVGLSGVTTYDLFANNNLSFGEKVSNAVRQLDENDFFGVNQQVELLSGGFLLNKNGERDDYLSFGVYHETDVIVYFPKDIAVLALEGNANNIGRTFSLDQIKATGESLLVFHLGYRKKASKKLNYGVRGKMYYSLINASSINNKGTFVTRDGTNNFYDHIFNLDLELRTSGIKGLEDAEGAGAILKGGNLGLGIDFGFTYEVSKKMRVETSFQDVGFIRHSKNIETYSIKNNYTFSGINPLFPEADNTETAQEYWDVVEDNFEELFQETITNDPYTTLRPVKFNAAVRYAFGEGYSAGCNCLNKNENYLNEIGLQWYSITRPKRMQNALTIYYYRELFSALRLKGTYTVDSYSFKNFGLGLTAQIGRVNFYLFADNLLDYQNLAKARSASLQLGFNYIFNKK